MPTPSQVIGQTLRAYRAQSHWVGLALVLADWALYVSMFVGICLVEPWGLKLLLGAALGVVIARLFQLGHTASHGALLAPGDVNRRWKRPLAQLCFLPSLMPEYSWDRGHNRIHHICMNQQQADNIWVPLSPEQYAQASAGRRLLERMYRHLAGLGLYYFDVMWAKMIMGHCLHNQGQRQSRSDLIWLLAFTATQVTVATLIGGPWWQNLLFAWILPFFVWNYIMGMTIYFHHTDENMIWYQESSDDRPSMVETALHGSRNVQLPWRLDAVLPGVMVHTVHHLSPQVPCYRQREATIALARALGEAPLEDIRLGWREAWRITKHCKLYDFTTRTWHPFPRYSPAATPDPAPQDGAAPTPARSGI